MESRASPIAARVARASLCEMCLFPQDSRNSPLKTKRHWCRPGNKAVAILGMQSVGSGRLSPLASRCHLAG